MKKLLTFLFISITTFSFSQNSWMQVYDIGDGTYLTNAKSVVQTNDNGYIITGRIDTSLYLIKTNNFGDTSWIKTFDNISSGGRSVKQTNDDGYIVASSSRLLKTNSVGDTIWTGNYSNDTSNLSISSMDITDDGGYVFTGNITWFSNNIGNNTMDLIIVKTDNQGVEQWVKTYGVPDDTSCFWCTWDKGNDIQQTSDGGYIITGYSHNTSVEGASLWLLKLNSLGNIMWEKFWDPIVLSPPSYEHECAGKSVKQTADGGYIIAGELNRSTSTPPFYSEFYEGYLIKTDSQGNEEWSHKSNYLLYNEFESVVQTNDGGFIVLGITEELPFYEDGPILMKFNYLGDTLWTKTYGSSNEEDAGYSLIQSDDGGFVFTGTTKSFGTFGDRNIWLVKTDQNGIVSVNEIDEDAEIILFPNPSNDIITLAIAQHSNGQIILTDILGKEVLSNSFTINEVQINLKSLADKGTYFAKVIDVDGNVIAIKKLIYQ